MRGRCISCGDLILDSAVDDPYLCRECEYLLNEEKSKEYAYIDE